jgi:plastocyanin
MSVVAVVLAVAVGASGCGDDASDGALQQRRAAARAAEFRAQSTPPTSASADPAVEPTGVVVPVVALDNTFRPQVIEIRVGDEVLWENRGQNEHDVLSVERAWGVEVASFQPGDVWAHVFTEPGEYRYYCSIHGNESVGMVGTVVVTA